MINYLLDVNKNPFFIETKIDVQDIFKKHQNNIIEGFGNKIDEYSNLKNPVYSVGYDDAHLELIPKYEAAIGNIFYLAGEDKSYKMKSWTYVQTPEKQFTWKFHHHNHGDIKPNLCTVTYFNVPKSGGQFCFKYDDEEYIIQIRENYLYIFPPWLMHTPLPHTGDETRICLNCDFYTDSKSVFKEFDHYW